MPVRSRLDSNVASGALSKECGAGCVSGATAALIGCLVVAVRLMISMTVRQSRSSAVSTTGTLASCWSASLSRLAPQVP